jgi:hypothetical protein
MPSIGSAVSVTSASLGASSSPSSASIAAASPAGLRPCSGRSTSSVPIGSVNSRISIQACATRRPSEPIAAMAGSGSAMSMSCTDAGRTSPPA